MKPIIKISKPISKPISVIEKKKIEAVTDQFIDSVMEKEEVPRQTNVDVNLLVPTGLTTLNLECSGHWEGAFKLGSMINIIGDSHAGKTLLAFTILAECSRLRRFNNYSFYYDDVEAANEFDLAEIFSPEFEERIDLSIRSKTIEDFNDSVGRLLDLKKPFIYVLDSFDALTSEAAIDKDLENRKKREKGNQTTGDFGDGKPKIFSRFCTLRIQELKDTNSFLIVISQTRDNLGFGSMFTPKKRSGGEALRFYSAFEIWLSCQKKEKEGKRVNVTNIKAKITKNKLTGRHGEVFFSTLFDYGFDNIKSCIDFLIDEGDWTGDKKAVNTKGFCPKIKVTDAKGKVTEKHPSLKELIDWIEKNGKEEDLSIVCQNTYDEVIESLRPERKHKYKGVQNG